MASGKKKPLQFELDDDDLKLFSEEAEEQIELLDTILVQLEGVPDPDLVQQIFRAAHTLKGSSATIGHKKMANLTHAMETVLDSVRQGLRTPNPHMVDALLAGVDALRILAQEVVTRIDSGLETTALEADLLGILEQEEDVTSLAPADISPAAAVEVSYALPAEHLEAVRAEAEQGADLFLVEVVIEAACQLPSIRCYQALQELDSLARVFHSWPERVVVESGSGEFSLTALVAATVADEQIHAGIGSISDVAGVFIRQVHDEEISQPIAGVIRPAPPTPLASDPGVAAASTQAPDEPVAIDTARSAGGGPKKASQSVRIDVERLDGLMNLVGELVIDRTRLQQIREQLAGVLKDANLSELVENFEETTSHLARITDELQEEIMRSRMLPVRSVLTRLPRLVRDVASKCGKKVELTTAGEETELDRSVIEEISDPLVHILRNAVDHGIETPEERRAAGKPEAGVITVTAWNQETYIYLSVKDDGKGIDTRALRQKAIERGVVSRDVAETASDEQVLQYIFYPGLSTAKKISDVSGRGVGMDIVRTNIERLNGQVTVSSTAGKGSEFIIQLPLTLATTKALMVMARDTVYAMPLVSVTEALAERDADVHSVGGRRTMRLRGKLLPLIDLAHALGDERPRQIGSDRFIVAAKHSDRQVAFIVDRLLGEQDVVVKTLGDLIGNRKGLTGATILGDGTLGLIIDTASLVAEQASLVASA
ncbi:MAG: chemotaxis protein CheA [Dehalococcoidia bacterium]|nr:chemotaxis protein CheA [Dehalococcoidia bacterium]